jgi:hypothetical protein
MSQVDPNHWQALYTFINEKHSEKVRKEMELYSLQMAESNWGKHDFNDQRYETIREAIRDKDQSKLQDLLDEDKGKETHTNLLYLLRFFTEVVVNLYEKDLWYPPGEWSDDHERAVFYKSSSKILMSGLFLPPDELDFFIKAIRAIHWKDVEKGNYPSKMLMPVNEKIADEIEKLIKGYGMYLERLEKDGGSKRSICLDIEKEIGVGNVRQEFNRYDEFFKKLEDSIQSKQPKFILDPETVKVIMEFCFNRAKAL